jgi:peptidoglycan hydrolase-like protein with peptidoglycan-binding domain
MNNNRALSRALLATLFLPFFALAQPDQSSCPNLSRNLFFGSRGSDVIALQNFLIAQDLLPQGDNTGYFGRLTKAAAIAFQRHQNLPTTDFIGRLTRSAIERVCGESQTINQTKNTTTNSNTTSTNTTNVIATTNTGVPNIYRASSMVVQNYHYVTVDVRTFLQTTNELKSNAFYSRS